MTKKTSYMFLIVFSFNSAKTGIEKVQEFANLQYSELTEKC